jgi:hypothetical protein
VLCGAVQETGLNASADAGAGIRCWNFASLQNKNTSQVIWLVFLMLSEGSFAMKTNFAQPRTNIILGQLAVAPPTIFWQKLRKN